MRPGIQPYVPESPWKNCHENFTHLFQPNCSWILDHSSPGLNHSELYRRATENLQWAIGEAIDQGHTLRAVGANWSFSPVAICNGGMIQTKGLDLIFNPASKHLSQTYLATGKTETDVRFVECGVQIARLNKELEIDSNPRRCIIASGGSNGQTIAGATSTGTHGAALFRGAVHDAIVGIHLVTGADTHVWLERASYPVASEDFVSWLGAKPYRDDDLFNAALVSFGSFGVIHGVMIETQPLFLLKEYRISNFQYSNELMDAFAAFDIAKLRAHLPEMPASVPGHELYHMEININPYAISKGNSGGMYVFLFYKVPVPPGHVVNHGGTYDPSASPEFIWMMRNLLTVLGGDFGYNQIKNATTREFEKNIRPAIAEPKSIGAIFRDTRFAGNVASFALAIAAEDLPVTIDEILNEIGSNAFAGAVAVRFVKGTKATLGFTKFENTCVVEMDGLDSKGNHKVFSNVLDRLRAKGLQHTLHWGKLNDALNKHRLSEAFGDARVNAWKKSRETLMTPDARVVFTNDFMIKCGLDTPAAVIV